MTSEMTWRKMPRNIIRDENLAYISDCLPPELKAAPLLFYMVALSIADDDGIFDLEDGVIFSRLMKMGTPEDVFKIARLFIKRKIILRAGYSTKCILMDWEYSIKDKQRTIDDRRKIVAKKIEIEQQQEKEATTFDGVPEQNEELCFNVDFRSREEIEKDDTFFCGLNDKNQENVTINVFGDKNQKNVVKNYQTEKNREDKNREKERIEHTQNRETREIEQKQGLRANLDGALQPCETELKRETQESLDQEEVIESLDFENVNDELVEQAVSMSEGKEIEEHEQRTYSALVSFFTKNCLGFKECEHEEALFILLKRINELADEKNPSEIVASVMTGQFKQLTETSKYYQNYAITPENLLKPGAYSNTLALASKILMNDKTMNKWTTQFTQYKTEYEKELAQVGDGFMAQYLKYGIDPNDPARFVKMLQAQANGIGAESDTT